MRYSAVRTFLRLGLLVACGARPVLGQRPGQLLESTLTARRIVLDAVAAIGGSAALNGLREIEYTFRGVAYNDTQSFDPAAPVRPSPITVSGIVDDRSDAFYQLLDSPPPGMTGAPSPTFYRGGTLYTTNAAQRQYTATRADPTPQREGAARFMPPTMLQLLLKNIRSATSPGEDTVDGKPAEVVDFSSTGGRRFRLLFDKADHRLRVIRFVGPDPLTGDDEGSIGFSGTRTVEGVAFPTGLVSYQHGTRFLVMDLVDVRANQPFDSTRFAVPTGYTEAPPGGAGVQTARLADHLYEISGLGGGYRSQFVDIGDGVVVFEAPLGQGVTRLAAAEIRTTLGAKPVKYVVLSHYHDDHASGVGVYAGTGAAVVTTRGNHDILTRYARAGSALLGTPAHPDLQPRFLDVTGRSLELPGANGQKLVVYRIDDVPHVMDLLVLYDPASRTIMNGDLFTVFFSPLSPSYRRLADWLESSDAPEVVRIAGVHHPPMTKAEFLALVRGAP